MKKNNTSTEFPSARHMTDDNTEVNGRNHDRRGVIYKVGCDSLELNGVNFNNHCIRFNYKIRLKYIPDPPATKTFLLRTSKSATGSGHARVKRGCSALTALSSPHSQSCRWCVLTRYLFQLQPRISANIHVTKGWGSLLGAIRMHTSPSEDIKEIVICQP